MGSEMCIRDRVTAELAEVDAELEGLEEEWLAAAEIDA